MKKSFLIKYLAAFLCLFMVVSFFSPAVLAEDWQDDDYSVTLIFVHDGEPVRNAHFRLYYIAEALDGVDNREFFGDFKDYRVTIDPFMNDKLSEIASTLSAYAARDALVPDAQGETDNMGRLKFKNLDGGVYLIDGNSTVQNGEVYNPQPFIVYLPSVVDDEEHNRVNANIKYEYLNTYYEKIERKVVKIWDDEGNPNRPNQIVAQLLCDGEVFDEVVLNAENNWRHTWSGLEAFHIWQVVEKTVPGDYSVSVIREGNTFVLTNTYEGDIPEEGWPTEPSSNDSSDPYDPSDPSNLSNSSDPSSGGDGPDGTTGGSGSNGSGSNGSGSNGSGNLPNTGLLWWPVPVLITSGFALFSVGFVKRKHDDEEK
ncbi:MAG: Cna B-type domain-containing protein [Oscillospiraceae bacterium]|nr:Cna B-type domain-containing protein [Oscillospiraceae bacterium]